MALTQIHGGRQILDGTVKNVEIATDAAIHNSKLDLSSISQSVILRHANGVLIEPGGGADEGQIRIRRNVTANPATSLFRLIVPAATDELTVERNTAAGGDFGTKVTHMSFRDDRILMAVPTLRLENVEASIQFRETDRALPGGLWRWMANGGDLRVDLNTALAGDFSTFATPLQITSGPEVQVNDRLLLSGSQAQIRFIQDASTGILNTSLRRNSGRLVWRDGGGSDQTLAYLSEVTSVTTPNVHEGGVKILGLQDPGTPTVTPQGTPGTTTWGYRVSAVSEHGQTLASESGEGTTSTGNAVLSATDFNRISWTAVPEAAQYKVYRTTADGTPSSTGLIVTVPASTTQFDDTGVAATGSIPQLDSTAIILLRNPNRNPNVGALYRFFNVLPLGGQTHLRLDVNLAAAGDFSTFNTLVTFTTTDTQFDKDVAIGNGAHLRLRDSRATIEFADAFAGSPVNGEMWRATESQDSLFLGRLKFFSPQSGQNRDLAYLQDLAVRETPTGAVDGVNTTYTLARTPFPNTEQVYLNGLLQSPGAGEDYTIAGNVITFASAPQTGDKIRVTYLFKSQ